MELGRSTLADWVGGASKLLGPLNKLQADAYAGFNRLYDGGNVKEAACWAHVHRKFFEIQQAHSSPLQEKLNHPVNRIVELLPWNIKLRVSSALGKNDPHQEHGLEQEFAPEQE